MSNEDILFFLEHYIIFLYGNSPEEKRQQRWKNFMLNINKYDKKSPIFHIANYLALQFGELPK